MSAFYQPGAAPSHPSTAYRPHGVRESDVVKYRVGTTPTMHMEPVISTSVSTLPPIGGVSGESHSTTDGERLVRLLWGDGVTSYYYEVQRSVNRNPPCSFDDAIRQIRQGGIRFIGVVPRRRPGNKQGDCAAYCDTLWADYDYGEPVGKDTVMAEVRPKLDALGLQPSAIVYSGRAGLHLYWKLEESQPIEEVENLNRSIAEHLGADRSCVNRSRILRLPGSVNEKEHGGPVVLLDLEESPIPTSRLACIGPPPQQRSSASRAQSGKRVKADPRWLVLSRNFVHWGEIDDLRLGDSLQNVMINFIQNPPSHGWRSRRHQSRSEMEMSITYRLVSKGWSDCQILDLADRGFPHHQEWQAANPAQPDRYMELTLAKARQRLFDERDLVSSPRGGNPRVAHPKKRAPRPDDHYEVFELARGQRKSELASDVRNHLGFSRATAYRRIQDLLRCGALVESPDERIDRSEVWLFALDTNAATIEEAAEQLEVERQVEQGGSS